MRRFGDLEAAIMGRLWAADAPRSVRELQEELHPGRQLAYNTVLTVVDNLFKKGWLERQPDGRAYRYRPSASRGEYAAQLLRGALDEAGDPAEAFMGFVDRMSPAETAALRAALAEHEQGGGK